MDFWNINLPAQVKAGRYFFWYEQTIFYSIRNISFGNYIANELLGKKKTKNHNSFASSCNGSY